MQTQQFRKLIVNYRHTIGLILRHFRLIVGLQYKEIFAMGTFFWEFDDYNDIARQWIMFIFNVFAFGFTLTSLIRTAKYHGKAMFELIPLSINTIATLILLFLKLFEKGYEFDLVGYVIEIFTYFLFCYTFSVMHSKLIASHRIQITKVCNFLFVFFALTTIAMIILVLSSVVAKDCDNDLIEVGIAGFITQLLSFLPTLYFGVDILRSMTKKHQEEKVQSSVQQMIFAPVSDQYIRQRKKQIKIVLIAYTVSLILRGFVLIFNLAFSDYIDCTDCEGIKIITSDYVGGEIVLIIIQINQLIPHLIIPIALYVIPVRRSRKSTDVILTETLLQQDGDDDISYNIQARISKSILSRSVSSPRKERDDEN